jgi:hypothetical protein
MVVLNDFTFFVFQSSLMRSVKSFWKFNVLTEHNNRSRTRCGSFALNPGSQKQSELKEEKDWNLKHVNLSLYYQISNNLPFIPFA